MIDPVSLRRTGAVDVGSRRDRSAAGPDALWVSIHESGELVRISLGR